MSTTRSVCAIALVCLALPACAATSAATRPRLTALVPDSARLVPGNVTEIVLRGSGFDTSGVTPGNTVRIGGLVLTAVPSSARGTVIRVAIPYAVPTNGEAPPTAWISGGYPVTVTTKAGTSDTLTIAIRSAGGPP